MPIALTATLCIAGFAALALAMAALFDRYGLVRVGAPVLVLLTVALVLEPVGRAPGFEISAGAAGLVALATAFAARFVWDRR